MKLMRMNISVPTSFKAKFDALRRAGHDGQRVYSKPA
jgi:hypothetical protein